MRPVALSRRALNRALLERQMLLQRRAASPLDAIEHLVGMQAQAPLAPYVGLWSRLTRFDPSELAGAITDRRAVRGPLLRATVHLVGSDDYLQLRQLLQPALRRGFAASPFDIGEIAPDALTGFAAEVLAGRSLTRKQLGASLADRWPDRDPMVLANAVTLLLPVIQTPPRGVWGMSGQAAWTTAVSWLGRALDPGLSVERLVTRYLAAYGPATVRDIQTWSGLTRLRDPVEAMRPRLARFTDEHDQELLDLPDAPRPDPELPAPPRFLPEYDNVLFAHADRARVIDPGVRVPLPPGGGAARGTLLIDGYLRATWSITRGDDRVRLRISPLAESFEPGPAVEEGHRLLEFIHPHASERDVDVARP